MTPKVQATKKTGKWGIMKIKDFCASKGGINSVKRHPTEQEKIFINHISDKRLISRIYKEFLKLNNKKTGHCKMGKELQ